MSKSKPTSHLRLHSSAPDEYERWNEAIATTGKPLTREMFERTFLLYGGRICGRCKKPMDENEGHHLIIQYITELPGFGEMKLPAHPSQFQYCPRCFDVLENGGHAKLEIVKEK